MKLFDIEAIITTDNSEKESLRSLSSLKEAKDSAYGLLLKGHLMLYHGINPGSTSLEEMESLYANSLRKKALNHIFEHQ